MGSSASKPEWYPGEPTAEVLYDECSCDPAATTAGLGSGDGGGATTATPSSQKGGGCFSTNSEAREITRLPVVELTDMEVRWCCILTHCVCFRDLIRVCAYYFSTLSCT